MLDGVTPVPPDFAARYRERGYWEDRPLFEGFTGALAKYAERTALVDEAGPVTYRELSDRSAHLARILLGGRSTRSRASRRSPKRSPRSASTTCSASTSTRLWGTTRSMSRP